MSLPPREHFLQVGDASQPDVIAERCWESIAKRCHLQAILVVRCNHDIKTIEVQWAYNLPLEAFNGGEKEHVLKALEDCFRIHPKPHVHAMKEGGLTSVICRFKNLQEHHRLWFFPFTSGGNYFVFLGFPCPETGKGLPSDLQESISSSMTLLDGAFRAQEMEQRLKVTDLFIKEVGHDISSAVQACVAKLRNIAEGRVTDEAARLKAKESEEEIWGVYRVAESLGIAADPNYTLKLPEDFDLNFVIKTVVRIFLSEAKERNIRLKVDFQRHSMFVWGESSAVQQAICQLVSNAIKYSFGGTDITISTSERDLDYMIRVKNQGHPLPDGVELKHIWDFGFRGRLAKERHVNGSGIGLYTVKKIITAHYGWTEAQSRGGFTDFCIHLPKQKELKRNFGVLI